MRANTLACDYCHRLRSEPPKPEPLPSASLVTELGRRRRSRKQKLLRRIEGLRNFRNRPSIDELPGPVRFRAQRWLSRLIAQARACGRRLDSWYLAILCGQAKRLARNPPTSAWGRSMRAKKGGYAVQRRFRREGRNPTARATHMSKWVRKARKRRQKEAEERARLGLPEPSRHGFTQGCNPWWD
jgi:hypothetical protein